MADFVPETTNDSLLAAKEKLLQQIQTMNLFDDVFTAVIFKDEGACRHLVRELMQNPTLRLIAVRTQDDIPQLISKSPRLDIVAEIDDGTSLAKLMQYLKTAKAGDTSQGALSEYVNYLKSPEGGREVMGEFEKYFREEGRKAGVEEGRKAGVEEGRKEGIINSVKALMQNTKISAQEAMRMLSIPPEEQQKLLPLL